MYWFAYRLKSSMLRVKVNLGIWCQDFTLKHQIFWTQEKVAIQFAWWCIGGHFLSISGPGTSLKNHQHSLTLTWTRETWNRLVFSKSGLHCTVMTAFTVFFFSFFYLFYRLLEFEIYITDTVLDDWFREQKFSLVWLLTVRRPLYQSREDWHVNNWPILARSVYMLYRSFMG